MSRQSSPAWSMPGRKITKRQESSPGPGQYTYDTFYRDKKVNYSVGKSSRITQNKDTSPGPGQYQPLVKDNPKTTAVFGTGTRKPLSYINPSPGPGNYNPQKKAKTTPSYSFRGVNQQQQKQNTPGPGSYQVPDQFDKRGSVMVGRGRLKQREQSPGPGQYNPQNRTWSEFSWSTAKSQRFGYSKQGNPGPGTYNADRRPTTPNTVQDLNRFGSGKRKPLSQISDSPGPGQYKDRQFWNDLPVYSMRGRITAQGKDTQPGPGAYNPNLQPNTKTKAVFGTGKRKPLFNQTAQTPGAGSYDPKLGTDFPTYSIQGKPKHHNTYSTPGPGTYESAFTTSEFKKYPAFAIGKDNREIFTHEIKTARVLPGPGQYTGNGDKEGLRYSFGKETRAKAIGQGTPGPGQYEIPSTVSEVPSYLISK